MTTSLAERKSVGAQSSFWNCQTPIADQVTCRLIPWKCLGHRHWQLMMRWASWVSDAAERRLKGRSRFAARTPAAVSPRFRDVPSIDNDSLDRITFKERRHNAQ